MRTKSEYYSIDSLKLSAAWAIVRTERDDLDRDQFEDFVLADWPEGEEHQIWLDNSLTTPEEIADWALTSMASGIDINMAGKSRTI